MGRRCDRQLALVGAAYWFETAEGGASLDVIAESFAASTEFNLHYGATTDEQFLEIVYRNVLGRDYDPGGFQYWLTKLREDLTRGGTVRWVATRSTSGVHRQHPPLTPTGEPLRRS